MNDGRRRITTSRGEFILRAERPEDDAFLFQLFVANNIGILHQIGLPQDFVDRLIAFQHQSQSATYRGMFPNAVFSIVEWQGEPVGRFIEHDEDTMVYFVDFALLPDHQAKGLGKALTRALMQEWERRGRGSRVKILMTNQRSLEMCRKLGFVETEPADSGYIELRWTPFAVSGREPIGVGTAERGCDVSAPD